MRAPLAAVALGLLVVGPAHAQDEKTKILDLEGKVIDLTERVESTGGTQVGWR